MLGGNAYYGSEETQGPACGQEPAGGNLHLPADPDPVLYIGPQDGPEGAGVGGAAGGDGGGRAGGTGEGTGGRMAGRDAGGSSGRTDRGTAEGTGTGTARRVAGSAGLQRTRRDGRRWRS